MVEKLRWGITSDGNYTYHGKRNYHGKHYQVIFN